MQHIPFPNRPDLVALPQNGLIASWLGGFDFLGLQTERDVAGCFEYLNDRDDMGLMPEDTRCISILSFPIGIDTQFFGLETKGAPAFY